MRNKRILIAIALILSLSLLTGGCTSNTKPASKVSETDKGEKVLRIAFPDTLTTLDVVNGSAATMLLEVAGVVQTLVAVDSNFALRPSLAAEWKRTGGTTWVFKLRDDVTFHDGTKMNAEAVKWCLERSLAQNPSFAQTINLKSVSVIDDYTVELETAVKTGELPEALTNVATAIVAKSSLNEQGEFTKAVGTGYFRQDSFDVSSGRFECVPYDGYWGGPVSSGITRRVVLSMPDSSTRSLAAQNGEVDIASDVPFSDLQKLAGAEGVKVEKFFTARTYFFSYNLNKPYLQDENVRKALIYAINKKELVDDVLLGVGTVPKGIFIDSMPWANTNVDTYEYDPAKAKTLLAAAGYKDSNGDGYLDKDGKKLALRIITGSRRPGNSLIVQAVQGYYKNIGVEAGVAVIDGNASNEAIKNNEYDLNLSSAATGYVPSASYYLSTYYYSRNTNGQRINYSNPELDRLIDECRAASDPAEKYASSKQAQAIAQNDAAVYTVANYGAVFVLSSKIKNFSYSAAVHDFVVPYATDLE
ncbi:ABC-type dipeptide transport system, periplasmic component [Desulfosporosinus orientis DSM 765]|uniref:ABC-type dipeptide transport system, periplasmic component n=1 Tax=Desulfosporosinus orientis (strain ATCC 19365 / DSM 765 / NCIMB 8382 / VKM B-1628 / Singapore I) TaxID=768706 RepID=G7WFI6_DESOD|nr:ABC transporter substrate-binding protein [Desulfosporosinus orientis]AET68429.1 ABC-type dipeptide transport system, periplasmic component [Desulfosporosinus orientis DSM 765]